MPLELKHNSGSTRTENSLAYHIPASSADYQKNSGLLWPHCLRDDTVHTLLPEQFRGYVSEVLHQFWWKGVPTLPWGARDTHLYFKQHYTYAPGAFCYVLSTAGTCTATGQESSTCWSLTVSRRKKERKKYRCLESLGWHNCVRYSVGCISMLIEWKSLTYCKLT